MPATLAPTLRRNVIGELAKPAYEAFKAVDKRRYRLSVRPVNQAWERISYRYLLRIVQDGEKGTSLALVFTFMTVLIKGRNLQLLAEAIDDEQCDFVQEYDAKKWAAVTNPAAAVITSIEIYAQAWPDEMLAGEKN